MRTLRECRVGIVESGVWVGDGSVVVQSDRTGWQAGKQGVSKHEVGKSWGTASSRRERRGTGFNARLITNGRVSRSSAADSQELELHRRRSIASQPSSQFELLALGLLLCPLGRFAASLYYSISISISISVSLTLLYINLSPFLMFRSAPTCVMSRDYAFTFSKSTRALKNPHNRTDFWTCPI